MKQLQQNQQNPQNKSKKLINFIVMILAILIVFTACHKKKKPFLLLPLIDNSSVATTDNGSGSGVGSSGDGGSGVGSSGDGGSGSGGPTFIPAQGILDDSFNSTGYYEEASPITNYDDGYTLALQSDGKILLGGGNSNFLIARFNPNGTLDTSFNGTGYIQEDISPTGGDWGKSIKILSDGNILLGGYCFVSGFGDDFCMAKFLSSDGSLDITWGNSGKKIQHLGTPTDVAQSLILDSNGRILMGGRCYNGNYDFCLARFDSNGNLDTTFNSTNTPGKVIQPMGPGYDKGRVLGIQSTGKILLAGYIIDSDGKNKFAVARFDTSGNLDTTFASSGKFIYALTSSSTQPIYLTSMVVQNDDKILLGGYCDMDSTSGANDQFCMIRLDANGNFDNSFDGDGIRIFDVPGSTSDRITSLAIQPDGKIIAGGIVQLLFRKNFV
ncbi:MAG: delta-60 repeat domain-containing protein [Leptospiraceae bacterium]|nr:delta-60 repeat domain-containing protein [Leptospiraceae bacterium]